MAKINNFELTDKIKVVCTDNDETYEVDYVSNEIFKSFENKDTRLILDGRINNR